MEKIQQILPIFNIHIFYITKNVNKHKQFLNSIFYLLLLKQKKLEDYQFSKFICFFC